MQEHVLKTWPTNFDRVMNGEQLFQIRVNDRNFQEGDVLHLKEFKPKTATEHPEGVYTGREIKRVVNRVFDGVIGLRPGYVLMTVRPVTPR